MWKILNTGKAKAHVNMTLDNELLNSLSSTPEPVLHLYSWEGDCATYGHFIKPEEHLHMEAVEKKQLNLGKRPTGGGIIFHICDLAFSALIPSTHPDFSQNTLENYAFVNRFVIQAVNEFLGEDGAASLLPHEGIAEDARSQHFCMAKPTKYDVIVNGKKVGGAAQRRTKQGLLHQGTISVGLLPDSYLEEVLLPNSKILNDMKENSYSLIGSNWNTEELKEARAKLEGLLTNCFLQRN